MTESYRIQKGESLSTIAAKYGVDWQQLALANDIPVTKKNGKPFALIQPGQTITIPPPGVETKSGKVEPPPAKAAPPPPKPKAMALEPMWQSEYAKTPKSGVIVLPDPPPPPPPPTIKQDLPPKVPGDFPPAVEGHHTPWYEQMLQDADPVKITSLMTRPGGTSEPDWTDYVNTASMGVSPSGFMDAAFGKVALPRIAGSEMPKSVQKLMGSLGWAKPGGKWGMMFGDEPVMSKVQGPQYSPPDLGMGSPPDIAGPPMTASRPPAPTSNRSLSDILYEALSQ